MNWKITTGLITLVLFLITFTSVFVNYTNEQTETLTKLGCSFEYLGNSFNDFKTDVTSEVKEVQETVQDHEKRLNKGGL